MKTLIVAVAAAAVAAEGPPRSFAAPGFFQMESTREVVKVRGWPDLKGFPLSFGIKAGGVVYASGMTGMDMRAMKMVEGGVVAETTQALNNLQELLEAAGGSLSSVAGCSVSLANMARDFAPMNKAYAEFWPKDPPTRVAVQVGALAGNSSVEIQCTAMLPGFEREVVTVPGLPALKGFPLSFAVRGDGMIYASGSQGIDFKTMKLVPGGAGPETKQTMENLKNILEAAGTSLENAVVCELSLRDMAADFKAANEAYQAFFSKGNFPARIAVQVAALAGGAAVEVRCTAAESASGRKVVKVPQLPETNFPLSSAIVAKDTVYASGMLGVDMKAGTLVPGGIANETRQALENLQDVLEAAGAEMKDVTICEVSLRDMKDFKGLNAIYASFWPEDPPARVAVQVGALALGASVEIKCTAVLGSSSQAIVV